MKKSASCLIIVALVFCLPACAKKGPDFNMEYYPQCYLPIKKMYEDESYSQEAKGGVTGALLGALGGAIVGGLTSGSLRGAAIGAATGGAAGAVTGSISAHLNKINNQDQRLEEYGRGLNKNIENWNIQRASVERSLQCYIVQTEWLDHEFEGGRMAAPAVEERLKEIRAGITNVKTFWEHSSGKMDATMAEGDKFLEEEGVKAMKGTSIKNPQLQKALSARQQNETKRQEIIRTNDRTTNLYLEAENLVNTLSRNVATALNK